ncbi:unnamed protein product [Arctia plantaginis]|uniref:BESS domain-containing protein n=1 Tax=Arctia plantaginis TaxID=874455 RepID=A0A8S0ZDW1_ARCPL|nr:unnamed protein product [Arctia plantaginis]
MCDRQERWFYKNMQFEYDPERLIEEVKKRPGIWDYEDADYRTKAMRYRLWNEVVNELMQADVKLTKSEMRELEIQLQKKWKSIRDCFQKYVTNPNRTKKPYIYTKQLQFLLKDQEMPRKEGPDLSSDSDQAEKNGKQAKKVWRKKQKLRLVKDDDESSEDDSSHNFDTQEDSRDYSNDGTDSIRPPKIAKISIPQSQLDEFAFANVDAQVKETEDSDKMFLLSLLPHLKTVPEESRLNVKVELMQVLRNANYSAAQHKII